MKALHFKKPLALLLSAYKLFSACASGRSGRGLNAYITNVGTIEYLSTSQPNQYGKMDGDFQDLIPFRYYSHAGAEQIGYSDTSPLQQSSPYSHATRSNDNSSDIIDNKGNVILLDLDFVYYISEGRAIVVKNGRLGLMNFNGAWLFSVPL